MCENFTLDKKIWNKIVVIFIEKKIHRVTMIEISVPSNE